MIADLVKPVEPLVFVHPLQGLQLIREQRVARFDEPGVVRTFVKGITRVGLVPIGVRGIANEIDGAVGAVLVPLPHNAPDAAFEEGVFRVAVERQYEQPAIRRDVESHALVHHVPDRALGEGRARRRLVVRENNRRSLPVNAVLTRAEERLARRDVLVNGIAEVLDIERVIPIGNHRRVVIRPPRAFGKLRVRAVHTQHLGVQRAYGRPQPAIMDIGIDRDAAHVPHRLVNGTSLCECGRHQQTSSHDWPELH